MFDRLVEDFCQFDDFCQAFYHCFGSLRAPFEEYQRVTDFISEKQNADGVYGNEKTAKAVLRAEGKELTCSSDMEYSLLHRCLSYSKDLSASSNRPPCRVTRNRSKG